ncbi:hypothetical protein ACQJBY_040691 [Aegilops geniculata]
MEDPDAASSQPETPDPDPTSLQEAMQDPVNVWLGPVGPLLRKLHSLAASLSDGLSVDEIDLLRDGLKKLCAPLQDMPEDEVDASVMAWWWMKIVRELCYDTEDHLDEVVGAGAHLDFSEFLARVKDASKRGERFQWWTIKPADGDRREAGVSRLTSPELPFPICGRSSTVGVAEPPKKLVDLLALDDDDKQTLKVISISGCAGVGKTTAARALYHRHAGRFQCRAFVTVSRNPDMRGFLTSMLSQFKASRPHGFPDVPDLIDAISKRLRGKRYFIVIDDLWTSSVWNIISRAFPRGDYCSRIITTTQIDNVALACSSYDSDCIYKMEPLNDHESRKLFFGRVFGSEDGCPIDIKEVSYDIIKKCSGMPLAIVNIASLLASQSNILMEKWEHIKDWLPSTSEERIDVPDLLCNMLNSLRPRLRTCLLYLSMYSEGQVIKKDELVKLWAAEGFLGAVGGQDTQEIAEGYFDELVSRCMVQAVGTNNNGEVLSCTVHQLVLDFIRLKSVEENFVINVDHFQSSLALPDKVRRLSVQFGGVKSTYIPESIVTSQVRSLIFWGFYKCVPSIMDCGLLRILILHIWADEENESFDLTGIGELFLLKYLEIECNITVKLPEKDIIPWLQHLETLQVDARLSAVPSHIINMKRLLHLRLPSEYILSSTVAQMISLRTLGYFDVSSHTVGDVLDLGELTNLQDLQLTCSMVHPRENLERNLQCLGSILEKLRVLQSITLVLVSSGSSCVNILDKGFRMASPPSPDPPLRKIELSWRCCIFFSLPKWFGELRNLCILKIAIRRLSMNDTDMLKGLPSLTSLNLYIQIVSEEKIVIDDRGFQVLTYFKFMCSAPYLSFLQGAMPRVQKLKIGFNFNQWRSHSFGTIGFPHLTGLTEVSVKLGVRNADEEFDKKAARSVEAAVRCHRNTLILRLQCMDMIFDGTEDKLTTAEEEEKKREEIQKGKKKMMERLEGYLNKQLVDSRYARKDPLTHHAQSFNVVTGAMNSLLPKLLDLLEDECTLQKGIKKLVDSLYMELEALQAALREVAKLEAKQLDEVLNTWARDVRDLSHEAEDIVDSLAVRVEGSDPETILKAGIVDILSPRTSALLSRGKARHEISDAIDDMMSKVQDLAARRERYKVGAHTAPNPNAAVSFDTPLSDVYKYPKDMVAIKVPRDEVIMMLTDGNVIKKLKIVSILGMGGLGKTTLVKAVYDKIRLQYEYTAFVSVSRYPDMTKVLMEILFQIDKQNCRNLSLPKLDDHYLIDEIRRLLQNKRYLIAIDNICDVNIWEIIKLAFVDNGFGSRVVTTTRIHLVARKGGEVYQLKQLTDEQSRELFSARLFNGDKNVPHIIGEVPTKILSKCDGVPLAIITAASLLVGKSTNDCSKVYNNIDFGSEFEDNTRKILKSNYYDLPYHLRACLLHLHMFQEDCIIRKEALMWKWAAEGLTAEVPGKGLFELGEGYLKELINRNLVMPVEDDSNPGKVIGCCVHDLVLDMICSLSTEENFITILDSNKQEPPVESKTRRLAVQKWDTEQGDPLANIRPERLRSFNTMGCHLSMELSVSRFKLMRVLALEECTLFDGNLSHLGKLLLLRYLGLYKTPIKKLPEDIGDLIYLQTLDLRGTSVKELPERVAGLRQLKCLRADKGTAVPDWMENLTSLEELRLGEVSRSADFTTELGKLTGLRELEIWIDELDKNQNNALVLSMRKLEKIQVLRIMGNRWTSGSELNWEDFYPPVQLRELHLSSIPCPRLPKRITVSRVPMLSHLSVYVKAIKEEDLDLLGALPELISLELLSLWDAVREIKGGGAFPRLKFFNTFSPFKFLPGAMPRLAILHFALLITSRGPLDKFKVNFENYFVNSMLGNLLSLEKVEVRPLDDVEVMCEAVRRGLDQHPNSPSLHILK